MDYDTLILHNDNEVDKNTGALSIPIYNASTYAINHCENEMIYEYSRVGNPTRDALENTIAKLENGTKGFSFPSGMSAITTVLLSILKQGDHAIFPNDIYGGTYRFITKFLSDFGIEWTFCDMTETPILENSIRKNTKLIFIETPSNPLLKITSIKKVVEIAKKNNIFTAIDNTFMSPYFFKPLDFGVDISIHSATKFLGGHSDLLAGVATAKNLELCKKIKIAQYTFGNVLSPQDSWTLLRGIKTLSARMKNQTESCSILVDRLKTISWIKKIHFPGLPDHPGHSIFKDETTGNGCIVSIEIDTPERTKNIMNNVKLWSTAVSLGGVESILSYPYTMSHGAMNDNEKKERGISKSLVRLSVGLENPLDLFEDLENAGK